MLEGRRLLSAASLDTSFSGDGKLTTNLGGTDVAGAAVTLSGNKVLVAGSNGKDAVLVQYTSGGSIDTSFGGGDGIVTTRFSSNTTSQDAFVALATLSGGKFLAAGTGSGTFALARFNTNGTLDTTFGPSHTGKVTTPITGYASANGSAITVQTSGKILVAGSATKSAGTSDVVLLRYNADGSADTTFGTAKNGQATYDFKGFNDNGSGVSFFSTGKIVVGATLTWKASNGSAGDTDIGVVRFNDNGTLDTTFSPGGTDGAGVTTADLTVSGTSIRENDYAAALMVSCGGRILVAGTANRGTTASPDEDFALVKFKYDGSFDTKFGSAHTGKVTTDFGTTGDLGYSLKMTPTNKIVVGGASVTGTTQLSYDFAAARYNADGTPDLTFNPSATTNLGKQTLTTNFSTTGGLGSADAAYALSIGSDGKMVLAGVADNDIAIARYSGNAPTGDGDDHLCGSKQVTPSKTGVSVSGTISDSHDVDLFAINVTAGQTIGFDVDQASGSSLDSYLRLFDFEGNSVTSNDNGAASGETLGKSSYLKYAFSTDGTYYIGISGAGNSGYDPVTENGATTGSTGGYSIVFTDLTTTSTDTVGNVISSSKSVSIGSTVTESISISTDVDLYSVTVIAGQTIGFDLDQSSGSTLDSYLRLFDKNGTQIVSNNDAAASGETLGNASYISYTFTTGGTYYIGVSGYANISYSINSASGTASGSTGGYSLVISNQTVDNAGGTTSTSKSIGIGSTTTEVIGSSTDIDVYKITVTSGQTITFNLNVSGSFDSYLRLFNSSGTQITFNDDGAATGETLGKASYISYTFSTGGTYYIGVSGHGNSTYNVTTGSGTATGSTGSYSFITTNTTPTGDPDDQISEAHSVSNNTISTNSISNSTDVDMFVLSVPAGATFYFDVDQTSGSTLDSYLRIFNSNGTQLASNDNAAASGETLGTSAYLSYTFSTAGSYYIAVSGAANKNFNAVTGTGDVSSSTGGYSLTITIPSGTDPDDQISEAHARTLNSTVSDSISTSTDVDAYSFYATAGTVVGIDIDLPAGSALESYLELVLSSGNYTTYNSHGTAPDEAYNSKESYIEYLVPTTGTYYVFVSGNPNENFNPVSGGNDVPGAIGAYSLTLTNITTQDTDDTVDAAHAISIGGTASDTISNPNDVDVFSFTVSAGQTIGFDVDLPAGSKLASYIELAKSTGQYIAYNSHGTAPDEAYDTNQSYLEYTFTTAGTYYVAVSNSANENFNLLTGGNDGAGASTSAGGYSIHLTDISAQDSDDQLTESHSISTSTTVSDTISNQNDVDVFKFTVSAGEKLSFDIDVPSSSNLNSYIEVTNGSGQYVAFNSHGTAPGESYDTKASYLEYTFATAGTYYIVVSTSANENYNLITGGADGAGATALFGAYSLIVKQI